MLFEHLGKSLRTQISNFLAEHSFARTPTQSSVHVVSGVQLVQRQYVAPDFWVVFNFNRLLCVFSPPVINKNERHYSMFH